MRLLFYAVKIIITYQNRFVTNYFNILPFDNNIILTAEQAKKAQPAIDDQREDPRGNGVDLHIAHIPNTCAVFGSFYAQ